MFNLRYCMKHLACIFILWFSFFEGKCQDLLMHYDSTYHINFGKTLPVQFEVITKEGKRSKSKAIVDGTIPLRKFRVKVTGGRFRDGEILIGNHHDVIDEKLVKVEVEYKPLDLKRTFFITIRFNGQQLADYKPVQPSSPIKLRLLRLGRRGFKGADGKRGTEAPDLVVYLSAKRIGNDTILLASIVAEGKTDTGKYYINPRIGKLIIKAEGGDGGPGEDGGEGLQAEGRKSPGAGGNGGKGGVGGDGGNIIVYYDSTMQWMMKSVEFHVGPGKGGIGGGGGAGGTDPRPTPFALSTQASGHTGAPGNRGAGYGSVVFIDKLK